MARPATSQASSALSAPSGSQRRRRPERRVAEGQRFAQSRIQREIAQARRLTGGLGGLHRVEQSRLVSLRSGAEPCLGGTLSAAQAGEPDEGRLVEATRREGGGPRRALLSRLLLQGEEGRIGRGPPRDGGIADETRHLADDGEPFRDQSGIEGCGLRPGQFQRVDATALVRQPGQILFERLPVASEGRIVQGRFHVADARISPAALGREFGRELAPRRADEQARRAALALDLVQEGADPRGEAGQRLDAEHLVALRRPVRDRDRRHGSEGETGCQGDRNDAGAERIEPLGRHAGTLIGQDASIFSAKTHNECLKML